MSTTLPGGYTPWNFKYDPEMEKVFNTVVQELKGVTYKMVASATQVVNGTNYAFIAEGTLDGLDQPNKIAMLMQAYQPIGGTPALQRLQDIGPTATGAPEGWAFWTFFTTTDPGPKNFSLLGVEYEVYAATSMYAGPVANMLYICKGSTSESSDFAALLQFVQVGEGPMVLLGNARIKH